MKRPETLQEHNRRVLAEAIAEYEIETKTSNRGNQIVETPDGRFHSAGEYKRWCELKIEARAGLIGALARQVPFAVTVNGIHICYWICDFEYVRDGQWVREDFKGYQERIFRLKRKLIEAQYGFKIVLSGKRVLYKKRPAVAPRSPAKRKRAARP